MSRKLPLLLLLLSLGSNSVYAGMPFYRLTQASTLRLEAISFFLFVLLLSPFAVKLLWNRVLREIVSLPPINYFKSLGLVVLWGILFNLVLTMIAGSREFMTPGAWVPDGATYKLAQKRRTEVAKSLEQLRLRQLKNLHAALHKYASEHQGKLPVHEYSPEIPDTTWQVPHYPNIRYHYRTGLRLGEGKSILAYEPDAFGRFLYVLFTNGQIEQMSIEEIQETIEREYFDGLEK